jgi:RNA polymerase sigma-70 factor (ECF subfamily)
MFQPHKALVKRCIRKDPAAQKELYQRFSPALMAVCYRYARDREAAEDMLQEGFIKIYQKLDRYTFQGSLEGWMRRIVVNTSIDILRKNKHQQKETDIEDAYGEEVSDDAIDSLELEYLFNLIQNLPTGYRLVFNMYAVEGYSHKEIGTKLGISESTSRSQYTRARSLLKKRIYEDNLETKLYRDAI